MHRRGALIAAVALLFAVNGPAQTARQLPKVSISLLADVPTEEVSVHYFLYGPFGAQGGVVQETGTQLVQIPAAVGPKRAEQIKMFVWAPGCKITTFDIPIQEFSDIQESFSCSALRTVTLVGQISPAIQLRKRDTMVSVDYVAAWACDFFGLRDCMVPQISLGTTKLDAEGVFKIELPDFSADAIASDSDGGAELQLILRETKTFNIIAFLEPESETLRANGGTLKISSFYPQNLIFAERPKN
jgi:hypothetical protein